jgi:DNA-binding response OmpR family regulator
MRLLLVDDEPHVGMVIRRVAEGCGFEVQITSRADEFRVAYEIFQPQVIALDLAIPDNDGIELLRFLAEAECQAQILIVSGFDTKVLDSAGRLGEAMGLRMAGLISKPMRVAELRSLFDRLRQAA